jgi:hypothetical protein
MLRDFIVKEGEMDEWVEEWRSKVVPLRLRFGFKVVGAWKLEDTRFVWILSYTGKKGDFGRMNERYYNSKERKAVRPDPARHLSKTEHWMMTEA